MKLFLYWNYKDTDSKKIYQFLKNPDFKNTIEENHDLEWCCKYSDFELNEKLMSEIEKSDLLLFFTHGDDDAILKFRYNDEIVKKRFTFIDLENASILKNKKVIAFCCRSAKVLGQYCISDEIQSKFFIGFSDDLIYSEGFTGEFKNIVYKTYSLAFEKVLLDAMHKSYTAKRFVLMLKKNIIDMLTEQILNAPDRKLGSLSGVSFHIKTAESLVVLGQPDQLVFE